MSTGALQVTKAFALDLYFPVFMKWWWKWRWGRDGAGWNSALEQEERGKFFACLTLLTSPGMMLGYCLGTRCFYIFMNGLFMQLLWKIFIWWKTMGSDEDLLCRVTDLTFEGPSEPSGDKVHCVQIWIEGMFKLEGTPPLFDTLKKLSQGFGSGWEEDR